MYKIFQPLPLPLKKAVCQYQNQNRDVRVAKTLFKEELPYSIVHGSIAKTSSFFVFFSKYLNYFSADSDTLIHLLLPTLQSCCYRLTTAANFFTFHEESFGNLGQIFQKPETYCKKQLY